MDTKKRVDIFIKKFRYKPEAYEVCPRFERCGCNKCPLHKDFVKLQNDTSDKERKCKCPKVIRKDIGAYFKLKNLGLSVRELNGIRLSIQISKQSLITQGKNLNTPLNSIGNPNNNHTNHLHPRPEVKPSGSSQEINLEEVKK